MLSREELEQVKRNIRNRMKDEESPDPSDFFTDLKEFDTASKVQECVRVHEVIESAEQLARNEIRENSQEELQDIKVRFAEQARSYGLINDEECETIKHGIKDLAYALMRFLSMVRCRLLPSNLEWPTFEGGARVEFGDLVKCGLDSFIFRNLTFFSDGSICFNVDIDDYEMNLDKGECLGIGEPPKPPEPPCKDRNGEIIHEGDTVYLKNGRPLTVASIDKHPINGNWHVIEAEETGEHYSPNAFTKKRPDCVDQILEEIESGKLTAASCIKTRLEAIKERKGADFGY